MEIKEILKSFDNYKTRVRIAHRINRCSPEIRKAIKHLYAEHVLPKIVLGIESPDGRGYVSISADELVNLYGMNNLQALLYLDDLSKANQKADKKDLRDLLGTLSYGKHRSGMVVTNELLEHVRQNSPDVWEQYQSIVEEEDEKEHGLTADFDKIADEEI